MIFVYGRYLFATGDKARASAVLRLVHAHPATESQTRPQIESLLAEWGCPLTAEPAGHDHTEVDLDEVVADMLRE